MTTAPAMKVKTAYLRAGLFGILLGAMIVSRVVAQAGADAAVSLRIWAEGQSGSSTSVWQYTSGTISTPYYNGPYIFTSGSGWTYSATYIGSSVYNGQTLYWYNYTSGELVSANLSVSGTFADGLISKSKAATAPNQALTLSLGSQGIVRVEPGKSYTLGLSYPALVSGSLNVAAPPQYRVILNGLERNRCGLSGNIVVTVVPRNSGPPGAAGFASSLSADRVDWQLPLGALRNGDSAGSIRLVDSGTSADWSAIYTPVSLYCESTSDEVFVYRQGNNIRQVIANQVAVDVVTVTSDRYELRCYNPEQIEGTSLPCSFSGQPFATYTIRRSDDSGDPATALKIVRDFRNVTNATGTTFPIVRTESTKLVRVGSWPNFTWTKVDWHTGTTILQETVATVTGMFDAANQLVSRSESLVLRTPGATPVIALAVSHGYTSMNFGEAFTSETVGNVNGGQMTFNYHQNLAQPGSLGFVESVRLPGGGWEAYDYYDSDQSTSFRGGRLKYKYRPYGNDGNQFPSHSQSQGEVTYYEYAADPFGALSRPALVQTSINGIVVSKRTTSYDSTEMAGTILATTMDYTNSTIPTTTITQYFSEGSVDSFTRGKPATIRRPDGVTQDFQYERGMWDGTNFTVIEEGSGTIPNASRIAVVTQAISGALDGVSTKNVTLRDSRALTVRSESYVYKSNVWQLVSWTNYSYNFAGLLTGRTSNNGATYSAVWDGNLKTSETDETGIVTTYTYDAAGRVLTSTRAEATSGTTTIAALTTTNSYDAAGHVVQQRVGPLTGEALVKTTTYDDAGRVVSETPAGLGTTQHTYNVAARTHTVTRPDGSTVIETQQLDGRLASRTGTGVVAQYYSYGVESDGTQWTKIDVGLMNSARWTKTWTDWLGRKTTTRSPGFTGQADMDVVSVYDSNTTGNTGRLVKTTKPGVAPTLYSYNTMSQLVRTGLDADLGGTLVTTSNDRISDASEVVELIDGDWWQSKTESNYPYTGGSAGTAVQVSKLSKRLTGLGGSTSTGQLREDTRTWDIFGNETRRTVAVDASTRLTTITTSRVNTGLTQVEKLLNGLPISTKSFEGLTTTKSYDALCRASGMTDPRTGTTTTTYQPNSTLVYEVTDPAGKRVSSTNYDGLGRVVFTKDALNYTTRTAYTLRGEVAQTWGSGTYPVSYDYNEYGERTKMRTYRDPNDAAVADSTTFPSLGTGDETTWVFDVPSGLLLKKYDAKVRYVEYDYDTAGRLWHRYWARTLPNSSTRVTTTYTYSSTTGEQTAIGYNDSTPGLAYAYDRAGHNTSVVQSYSGSSVQTLFDYCLCGKLSMEYFDGTFFGGRNLNHLTNPNADGFKGRGTGYALTVGSTVEQSTTYGYESATGRFSSLATSDATHTFNYGYLANSNMLNALSVDSGHPFTITRTFEPNRDLLTSIEAKWSTATRTKYAYTYDDRAQRANVVQAGDVFADYGGPSSGAIHQNFAYNGRGEVVQAASWLGDLAAGEADANFMSARKHEFAYDGIGNRRWSNTGGIAGTRDNYSVNELNQYVARENNTLPVGGTVANDSSIKVVAGSNAVALAGRHGRHWGDNMLLDNLNGPYLGSVNIYAAKVGGGAGGADLFKTVSATAFLPPAWQTFSYDADGNILSDGVWNYMWDAENRLIAVETMSQAITTIGAANARRLEFKYDHLGRRIEKLVRAGWNGSTYATVATQRRFLYDGWNVIAEYSVSGNVLTLVRTMTWGLDIATDLTKSGGVGALLQIADHSLGKAYFAAYDGNGNVAALFDGASTSGGTMAAAYEYSPYGEFQRCEGTYAKENPFRFSTKFTDDETGLVYYGRRYYSPSQGRFLGRDPEKEKGGLNLYAFVRNNVINAWDVLGMGYMDYAAKTGWATTIYKSDDNQQLVQYNDGAGGGGGALPQEGDKRYERVTFAGGKSAVVELTWHNFGVNGPGFYNDNIKPSASTLESMFNPGNPNGETGLTGLLLNNGVLVDNQSATAAALGRWQGAVDADNTVARMKYFAQYLATRGDYKFEGNVQTAMAMALPAGAPGQVVAVTESMSLRAARYQTQITGLAPGYAYLVNGVKFDGFEKGVLLEAKGEGYASAVRDGAFADWFDGATGLLDQAQRQLAAANGTAIRWSFAEEAAANATRRLFSEAGITGIDIRYVAPIPHP